MATLFTTDAFHGAFSGDSEPHTVSDTAAPKVASQVTVPELIGDAGSRADASDTHVSPAMSKRTPLDDDDDLHSQPGGDEVGGLDFGGASIDAITAGLRAATQTNSESGPNALMNEPHSHSSIMNAAELDEQKRAAATTPGGTALPSSTPPQQRPANAPVRVRNVYVAALPLGFTEPDLMALLTPFGKVKSVRMFNQGERVQEIGRSYGFALFDSADSAEAAVRGLDGQALGDARIQCQLSRNGVVKKPKDWKERARLQAANLAASNNGSTLALSNTSLPDPASLNTSLNPANTSPQTLAVAGIAALASQQPGLLKTPAATASMSASLPTMNVASSASEMQLPHDKPSFLTAPPAGGIKIALSPQPQQQAQSQPRPTSQPPQQQAQQQQQPSQQPQLVQLPNGQLGYFTPYGGAQQPQPPPQQPHMPPGFVPLPHGHYAHPGMYGMPQQAPMMHPQPYAMPPGGFVPYVPGSMPQYAGYAMPPRS